MRKPAGEVPRLGQVQTAWHTSPRSQAEVTVKTFSLASTCCFVSIFPRAF